MKFTMLSEGDQFRAVKLSPGIRERVAKEVPERGQSAESIGKTLERLREGVVNGVRSRNIVKSNVRITQLVGSGEVFKGPTVRYRLLIFSRPKYGPRMDVFAGLR